MKEFATIEQGTGPMLALVMPDLENGKARCDQCHDISISVFAFPLGPNDILPEIIEASAIEEAKAFALLGSVAKANPF